MKDITRKQFGYLVFLLISFALYFPACGGGDNPPAQSTATVTGTVPGTTVKAIDENNNVVASVTATGSPKTFILKVPANNRKYKFAFIENECTPQFKACYLYQGNENIFQINSPKDITIDLGFVDTSTGKGVANNNPLNVACVTCCGEDQNIHPCMMNIGCYAFVDAKTFLEYRTFETASPNYYLANTVMTKDGNPITQGDVQNIQVVDSQGGKPSVSTEGFYSMRYYHYDCTQTPCTITLNGPQNENGFYAIYNSLQATTYTITVNTTDGKQLTKNISYPGQLALPVVRKATMQGRWDAGDLVLSWTNPTAEANWANVTRITLAVYDGAEKAVLFIRAATPAATEVRVPASLLSQAAALGNGTLAKWEVQTKASDANSSEYARGYSDRANIPQP